MIDFTTITYLKTGTPKQQRAYWLITENLIFDILKAFDPVLAGTIPIGIDIESSDLDILCYCKDMEEFAAVIRKHFAGNKAFTIKEKLIHSQPTVLANFWLEDFEIEIFGQHIPVQQQFGYRHMMIEHKLLERFGEVFRNKVIGLKQQGFKTEPAFAELLGLSGDPYQSLLQYENRDFEYE